MKEEKETRWVPEFEDRYNIFQRYSVKMSFEDESYDPTRKDDDYSSDEDGKGNLHLVEGFENEGTVDETGNDATVEDSEEEEQPYDREAVLKYISQVRNSFGFDVDVRLPPRLVSDLKFVPADVSHPLYRDHVYKAARFAIEEINVDMEKESKTYEFVEIAKAVYVYNPHFLMFLTLVVKNVGEEEAATTTIQAIVNQPRPKTLELHQWKVKPDASP